MEVSRNKAERCHSSYCPQILGSRRSLHPASSPSPLRAAAVGRHPVFGLRQRPDQTIVSTLQARPPLPGHLTILGGMDSYTFDMMASGKSEMSNQSHDLNDLDSSISALQMIWLLSNRSCFVNRHRPYSIAWTSFIPEARK
jgi:hypothetical protein